MSSERHALNLSGPRSVKASTPDPARAMPIHVGIMCKMCRKVHFIATSRSIRPSKLAEGMYRVTCIPPCLTFGDFRKENMRPYRVSDDVFKRGYATDSEYESIG